jgi:outer membrane receptor protein involved in Fe transport
MNVSMNDHYIRLLCITVNAIFLLSVCTSSQAQGLKPGRLTGIIRDESNQPVAGASVTIENQGKGTSTSVSGDYVLVLAPGTYTVLISAINFSSQRLSDVIIKSEEQTDLSVTLRGSRKDTLSGITVTSNARRATAAGLLLTQKNSVSMTDGISTEQMVRTPDANAAQALRRVSGVTIQGDKFITIRGVSDRYNNVLINGASLPSTEPNRRNFSFDAVPSSLIDNIIVNKTATPDLPGEFTGGVVQINTKDVPVKNFIEMAIGTGINSESFDRNYNSFKRDKNAILGKIDENRKWYGGGRVLDPEKYLKDFLNNDTNALRNVAGQIPNRWQKYRYSYVPARNYQLSGGLAKRFANSNALGVIVAITYSNEQVYEEGEGRSLQVFEGLASRNKLTTSIGGLLNTAYKTKKHKIAWKNLYNLRYSHQFDKRDVLNINIGVPQERLSDVIIAGKMWQTRLEAEHLLTKKNIKLDWSTDYIKYSREQPDSRFLVGIQQPPNKLFSYNFTERNFSWGGIYSSVLNETRNNAAVNLAIPFIIKGGDKQLIKIGYAFSNRESDFEAASFRIRDGLNNYGSSHEGLPFYEITSPENFTNGNLTYSPAYISAASTGDEYNGTQKLHAAYVMADVKFLKKLRLTGGMRNENNRMEVSTIFFEQQFNPVGVNRVIATKTYVEKDWLPSVNLIYSISNKINVRGAFSKTVARPDFVERSPFLYYDFPEQLEVSGEQALQITRIKNYDLRFEFYPSGGEILSASVFHKYFDNPVERFFIIGNPSNTVEYRNLYSAVATGFEVDLRKNLQFLSPGSSILKNIVLSSNFTYLSGKISYAITRNPGSAIDDTFYVASQQRPIQGLSPYIINLGLSYQETLWGLNLAFNRSGRKIVNGGIASTIVQYENPRSVLDFQLNGKMLKQKLELRFNIGDIINQPYINYSNNLNKDTNGGPAPEAPNNDPKGDAFNEQFDYINYKVKKGVNFSLKLIYKF